jgi:UDP-glucose 4-epimerase
MCTWHSTTCPLFLDEWRTAVTIETRIAWEGIERRRVRQGQGMSHERILVTGGFGFVGSAVVKRLVEQGEAQVQVLDDCSLGVPENLGDALPFVTSAIVDIRDRHAMREAMRELSPDVVIHLAALHFIPACDEDPKRCLDINVGGTQAVLDGCADVGAKAVVLASTAAVYAPDTAAHGEDAAIGPTDVYGLSKLFSEQLGELFHRNTSTPVGVARLFNVFGPGETNPHLIPAVIRQAERGGELRLGNLTTKRDYVFVDDVADGLIALAREVRDAGAWMRCNLGREEAVDGHGLVSTIGELMGVELAVENDPRRMRRSDRPVLLSDCSGARSSLRWRAGTSLRDGLAAALQRPTAAGVSVE